MSFIPQRISVGTISSVTGTTGTGAAGRVAYWSDATTLTSSADFTYSGGILNVGGVSTASLSTGGLAVGDRIAATLGSVGTPTLHSYDDADTGFNIVGSNVAQIVTAGVARVTFNATGGVGIEAGSGADSMLRVRGNSTTSGANQWGIIADTIFSSSGTSSGYTITAQVQTAAASFAVNRAAAFQVAAASLGAGSSVTRLINCLLSEQTAGTNNASIADNIAFSGNWFINSTSTSPSSLAGQMRVASLGVANSAAATTLGTVTSKIEVFDASGASLGFVPVYDAIT